MISPTLADAIFWVAVAACLVAQAAIVRSVASSRAAAGARKGAELLWAVVPALALAVVLAATWRTLHPRAADVDTTDADATAPVTAVRL